MQVNIITIVSCSCRVTFSGLEVYLKKGFDMKALVFPGQGSQFIGMGKELSDSYPEAKAVFDKVDEALGEKLSTLIWEGKIEDLTLTRNTQPALMATSMAVFAVLSSSGVDFKQFQYVLGHSLGEYSALTAAGCLSLEDSARLLRVRGDSMQESVAVGFGAMAAILGLNIEDVTEIVMKASKNGICEIANDNDPAQIVISGEKDVVDDAIKIAQEKGAKRAILLPVSAPFHCQMMSPASKVMRNALGSVQISRPRIPLISNVTGRPTNDPNEIRELLVEQVTGTVQWRKSILFLGEKNISETWEIGAGKALSGMIRRTAKSIETRSIIKAQDITAVLQTFNN